jgi:hypothetical protein
MKGQKRMPSAYSRLPKTVGRRTPFASQNLTSVSYFLFVFAHAISFKARNLQHSVALWNTHLLSF